jgi:GTP cyclohydrolase I
VSETQDEFVMKHADSVEQVLSDLEAWHRTPEDHRADTPQRFLKMLWQLTHREEFNFTTFPAKSDEMIVLGPIPFYTMCAHHTAPFFGNAFIGYVPNGSIAGLSKFARAVKYLAKGFWVQEELTTEIATYLERKLYPRGIAVVVQAEHLCMAMRGVQQPGVITTTSSMRGVFADHDRTAKAEFMQFIERSMR